MNEPDPVGTFWNLARFHAKLNTAPSYFGPTTLEVVPPPAWSFGSSPEVADELLALVLDGTKTATSSALAEYESENEPLPEANALGILLDGSGHPRVLIETTDVSVVSFSEVDEEHARLEGEGDLSLSTWREIHEEFFSTDGKPVEPSTQVVLERFRIVYVGD
ncbi:hypothetical protein GCM10027020_08170 [Nocardioides salsibiostraticola]